MPQMPPTGIDLNPFGRERVALAQRVADAHRDMHDASLMALVSGSTVEGLADARSDIDMSIVFAALPDETRLRAACRSVGHSEWAWQIGTWAEGSMVVAFPVDGIEVQIAYSTRAQLDAELDQVLVAHDPDTPNHKLAEGLQKALPLAGDDQLAALKARLAEFPPALRLAMVKHGLAQPTPWRAITQIIHRDAGLWCREIQVEACYRLLRMLCGLNRRYFTRFQLKRMRRLAASLAIAPAQLAERIERVLAASPRESFTALHALEGEVIALLSAEWPELELAATHARRAMFASG